MKRYWLMVLVAVLLLACDSNDKLWEKIGGIETRLTALEQQCKELNENISSLRVMMEALQENDYITGVAVVLEDGVEVGYKITFNSHPAVMIFHGKSNAGLAPVIGVKQADDGFYYWTQKLNDGQTAWILDEHGKKVKVAGSDGQNVLVMPQLKIENGHWMLSVDDGATWQNLGSAQCDSFFANITNEEDKLILELQDGTVIELPKKQSFSFSLDKTCISNMFPEASYEVNYTITAAENQNVQVETIGFDGCEALVQPINAQNGKIVITPSSKTTKGKIMVFAANERGDVYMQTVYLEMIEIITTIEEVRAHSAYVTSQVPVEEIGTAAFEYSRSRANEWTRVEATINRNIISAKLSGLRPDGMYYLRPVIDGKAGKAVQFYTEGADQIIDSGFDWWNEPDSEGLPQVWDSGNAWGASLGVIPTTKEKTDVISGSAVRLQSQYKGKFVSGSLFTGKFVEVEGLNAKLDFGIDYDCRPTKLKGYYKYQTSPVNYFGKNNKFDFLRGTNDSCHIYVALCDWTEPFHSDLEREIFVDYSENNPSIIAYGELKNDRMMMDSYEPFTIDIKYRDTTRTPRYIVIVATSSKYGHYFAGGEGSVLLIDEFELSFD